VLSFLLVALSCFSSHSSDPQIRPQPAPLGQIRSQSEQQISPEMWGTWEMRNQGGLRVLEGGGGQGPQQTHQRDAVPHTRHTHSESSYNSTGQRTSPARTARCLTSHTHTHTHTRTHTHTHTHEPSPAFGIHKDKK